MWGTFMYEAMMVPWRCVCSVVVDLQFPVQVFWDRTVDNDVTAARARKDSWVKPLETIGCPLKNLQGRKIRKHVDNCDDLLDGKTRLRFLETKRNYDLRDLTATLFPHCFNVEYGYRCRWFGFPCP